MEQQPLAERLAEAESHQTQAEQEVAAQLESLRRELMPENDESANTVLDQPTNRSHKRTHPNVRISRNGARVEAVFRYRRESKRVYLSGL